MKQSYGLGWAVGGETFGHGGALATDITVDRTRGLVYVYLVHHAGFPGDGGKAKDAFRKVAEERFGTSGAAPLLGKTPFSPGNFVDFGSRASTDLVRPKSTSTGVLHLPFVECF